MSIIRKSLILLFITLSFDMSSQTTIYINNLNGPVKQIIETSKYLRSEIPEWNTVTSVTDVNSDSISFERPYLSKGDGFFVVDYKFVKEYSKSGFLHSEKRFDDCFSPYDPSSNKYHNGNLSKIALLDSCIIDREFTYHFDRKNRISRVFINESNIHQFSEAFVDTLQSIGLFSSDAFIQRVDNNKLRIIDKYFRWKHIINYKKGVYTINVLFKRIGKNRDLFWQRATNYYDEDVVNLPYNSTLKRTLTRDGFHVPLTFSNKHKASMKLNDVKAKKSEKLDDQVWSYYPNSYNRTNQVDGFLSCNYQYNNKRDLLGVESYNFDGVLKLRDTYIYDSLGNLLERNCFDSDSILISQDIYQYNDKGLLIYELYLGKFQYNNTFRENIFTTDSIFTEEIDEEIYEEIIEEKHSIFLDTLSLFEYQYNKYGDCIQSKESWKYGTDARITCEGNSKTNIYRFQYDSYGNWIKKERLNYLCVDGELDLTVTDIITRDIYYY